ncbi:MAG: glycosyltransferase family 4 protein [Nitrospinales bacterium]
MNIGIAGPMTLRLLKFDYSDRDIPVGYDFPMISMLINSLLGRGFKVVAYTTSVGIESPVVFEGEDLIICIARRDHHAARDLFKSERADLNYLMKKYSVDIINAHWSYEFAWSAINTGIPTLVTVRDHAFTIFKYQFDLYRLMRLIMNNIVLKKAKYISVNSKYLFNKLAEGYKAKSRIINNFFAKELEAHFKCPCKKDNYVVSVSNGFGKRKNIETALKAFALVKKQYSNIEYYLIGDGMEPFGPAYEFAKGNNILNGIKFLGNLPFNEVIQKVQKASIFLHPSREESFGMAVLEAMILGTPVIGGARSGNIPYLLDHAKAGELCNINSPEAIQKSMLKILQNKRYANKLIRNAHNYAEKNYSENLVISKYLDYYYDILNQ